MESGEPVTAVAMSAASERILELYVAGDTSMSRRARLNLDAVVALLHGPITVRVVDVTKEPKAAFARRIFATPSLVSIWEGRTILVIGDLADRDAVLQRLSAS
jgi:hypothetical protein